MEYFFLIISSLTIITTTGIIIKYTQNKKRSDLIQKQAATASNTTLLINKAMKSGDINDLLSLEKQAISLSEEQKLQILVYAYSINNESIISYFKGVGYKLSLSTIIALFFDNNDREQVQFLLINFLDKKNLYKISPSLSNIIAELLSKDALDVISSLLEICPENTLGALFFLVEQNSDELAFQYITKKTEWLQKNSSVLNESHFKGNIKLINFLLNIFPKGELGITILGTLIAHLIEHDLKDLDLYKKVFLQINLARTGSKRPSWAGYNDYLKGIIGNSISHNRFDVLELIIQFNQDVLSEKTQGSAEIVASYVHRNPEITKLFFCNGTNVNRAMPGNISIAEHSIVDNAKTNEENQSILDILLRYGLDLNTPIVKSKPPKISELSLLGYLVFTSLVVPNNPDFNALRLQKNMALFFDIPGTSYSNGTLCVHERMRESYAHWNYLLDLYFKNLEPTALIQKLPESMSTRFNLCLKRLYSADGTYDNQLIYDVYNKSDPIVLPVNLRADFGEAHIATVGFMKVSSEYHLRIEADRGLGRTDFSIFIERAFSSYDLSAYTHNSITAMPLYEWHQDDPDKKNKILTIDIGEQKSNSCPSTSAKYAFHIAYFLCEIYDKKFSLTNTREDQIALIEESYNNSKEWFEDFLMSTKTLLVHHYEKLDSKYIDPDFLFKVQTELTNDPTHVTVHTHSA